MLRKTPVRGRLCAGAQEAQMPADLLVASALGKRVRPQFPWLAKGRFS